MGSLGLSGARSTPLITKANAPLQKVFTVVPAAAKMLGESGRVAELADAKDLGFEY